MPRDGSNVYHIPPGTEGVPDTVIESAKYNAFIADVEQDLNTARPILAGGTGAINADAALVGLGAEKASQVVTNYNSHVFVAGSFYSASSATGSPVTSHAFAGIVYVVDANNLVIEARDLDDTVTPPRMYVRQREAGIWGAWTEDLSGVNADIDAVEASVLLKVAKAGDTMTGPLVLPAAAPTLGTHATNKTYVDAQVATAVDPTEQAAFVTAAAVRHDIAQTLTATQKRQAQANLFQGPTAQYLTATGTYTTSGGVTWIEIELVGGGAGGAGSGTGAGSGNNGGITTWGTGPILSSGQAIGGVATGGGAGGTPSGGFMNKTGGAAGNASALANSKGGMGGISFFGGAGDGGAAGGGGGMSAIASSGSGGGGAGSASTISGGGGGGSGGYVRHIIHSPNPAYGFTIGNGGNGGAAGTSGAAGGNGAAGGILVTEHYGS